MEKLYMRCTNGSNTIHFHFIHFTHSDALRHIFMKNIVTTQWLHQYLNDPDLVLLDASPATNVSGMISDFANVQIKGARIFDIKKKFSDQISDMPNTLLSAETFTTACRQLGIRTNSKIVVYDNLGIYTAPRVWWMFRAMGHQTVAVLDGGLPEWVNQGFETVPIEEKDYPVGDFAAHFNPDLKRNMEDIVRNIRSKEAIVIDARSAGRFNGTAPEPRAGLSSGHIPDSLNLPFPEVLNEGKMKSQEALTDIFKNLTVNDQPLVFSCGSGITACIIMLAAETVMDNPMSVYDGSWTEWAQKQPELIES